MGCRFSTSIQTLRTPGGLRLYFTVDEDMAIFVAYGTKDTQQRDIERALRRIREYDHAD